MGEENNDAVFLSYVIKEIVNNPDDVVVSRSVDEMGVLLSVKVNPEDMGLLIGRSGSTAKAVRTLVRIVGMKTKARVNMRIEEPAGSTFQARHTSDVRTGSVGYSGVGKDKSVDDIVGEIQ